MRKNSGANTSVSQRNETTLALLENLCKIFIDATDHYFVQVLLIFLFFITVKIRKIFLLFYYCISVCSAKYRAASYAFSSGLAELYPNLLMHF